MNVIDILVIVVLLLVLLKSLYKGFLYTACGTGLIVLSIILSFIFMPVMANSIKSDAKLFDMMLFYTEGSEFIQDSELAKQSITTISTDEVNRIVAEANVPHPIGKEIRENILTEAFAKDDIVTLGDYFNQTMVRVFINILSLIFLFLCFKIVFGFLLGWFDYSYNLPKFTQYDSLFAVAAGLLKGILTAFVIFMLVPIALTLIPLDFIKELVDESFFARLFYNSNFLLSLIPGM